MFFSTFNLGFMSGTNRFSNDVFISSTIYGTHQTLESVQEQRILDSISKIRHFRLTDSTNFWLVVKNYEFNLGRNSPKSFGLIPHFSGFPLQILRQKKGFGSATIQNII
jgi:hypothetical protein